MEQQLRVQVLLILVVITTSSASGAEVCEASIAPEGVEGTSQSAGQVLRDVNRVAWIGCKRLVW